MSDPTIHSESWTGPQEDLRQPPMDRRPGSWSFGKPGRAAPHLPASGQQRQWARLVGFVFLSPLLLLASWFFVHAASADILWTDQRHWLVLWGLAVIAIGAREVHAGIPAEPAIRSRVLTLLLTATCAFSVWYPYAAISAHSIAVASAPERTFELYFHRRVSHGGDYFLHQRRDGTTIEGSWAGPAVRYGTTCALTQRLNGDYGFSWIRVIERTAPPAHEVLWPIRREDCFSRKPLSTLRG